MQAGLAWVGVIFPGSLSSECLTEGVQGVRESGSQGVRSESETLRSRTGLVMYRLHPRFGLQT